MKYSKVLGHARVSVSHWVYLSTFRDSLYIRQIQLLTNPHVALKSRHITANKVCIVKDIVFPAVKYGCESWTIKKAECQRTDAFELWCWRRLLRVPWAASGWKQSILNEIDPEYSLEAPMLKLKLQDFGHLMQRADSLEKTPRLGQIEGKRTRGQQRMRWLDGWHHWFNGQEFSQTPGDSEGQGGLACSMSTGSQRLREDSATEQQRLKCLLLRK